MKPLIGFSVLLVLLVGAAGIVKSNKYFSYDDPNVKIRRYIQQSDIGMPTATADPNQTPPIQSEAADQQPEVAQENPPSQPANEPSGEAPGEPVNAGQADQSAGRGLNDGMSQGQEPGQQQQPIDHPPPRIIENNREVIPPPQPQPQQIPADQQLQPQIQQQIQSQQQQQQQQMTDVMQVANQAPPPSQQGPPLQQLQQGPPDQPSPISTARTYSLNGWTHCAGTESGKAGVCKNDVDCKKAKGRSEGSCMGGLGVCCVIALSCGDKSSENNTFFANPDFPEGSWDARLCEVEVKKKSSSISQILVEFEHFELALPDHEGECVTDIFQVKLASNRYSPYSNIKLCGMNTGQHLYLDVSQIEDPIVLSVATSGAGFSRRWSIKIIQMDNKNYLQAPPGCLQYYTDTTGIVRSFNLGKNLRNLYYAICFRIDNGYSGIRFTDNFFGMSGGDCPTHGRPHLGFRKKLPGLLPGPLPPPRPYGPQPQYQAPPPPQTGYRPAPQTNYSPAPQTSYAPAPQTSYAPAPQTSYGQATQGGYSNVYNPHHLTIPPPGHLPPPPGYTPTGPRYKRNLFRGKVSNTTTYSNYSTPTQRASESQRGRRQVALDVNGQPMKRDHFWSSKPEKEENKEFKETKGKEEYPYQGGYPAGYSGGYPAGYPNSYPIGYQGGYAGVPEYPGGVHHQGKSEHEKFDHEGKHHHQHGGPPPPPGYYGPPPQPLQNIPGPYPPQAISPYGPSRGSPYGYQPNSYGQHQPAGHYGGHLKHNHPSGGAYGPSYGYGPYGPQYPYSGAYHKEIDKFGKKYEDMYYQQEKNHKKGDKKDEKWWEKGDKKDDKKDKKEKDRHHEVQFPELELFEPPHCEPRSCSSSDVITFPPSTGATAEMCGNQFNRGRGSIVVSGSPLVVYVNSRGRTRGFGFDLYYEQVFALPHHYY